MRFGLVALRTVTSLFAIIATCQPSPAQDDAQAAQTPGQGQLGRGGFLKNLTPYQRNAVMQRVMQRRAAQKQNSNASAPPNLDSVNIKSDVSYGPAPLQKLDIYTPKDSKQKLPIVIFVHGGGWSRGDKAQGDRKDKGCAYVGQDIIMISTNYRLAPNVVHPEQARDIASAFAWVKEHASEFGGDPNRIYLMGHSAGAHLVDLIGTNDRFLAEKKLGLKDVGGVISLDTASLNLTERRNDAGPETGLVGPMIDTAFGKDPKVLKDASPTLSIQKGKSYPPFLMFCGSKRLNCVEQHKEFAKAMTAAGGQVTVKPIPLSHGDINRASGQPDSDVFKACVALIKGGAN